MITRRQALLGVAAFPTVASAAPDQILSYRPQNGYYEWSGGPGQTFTTLYQLESSPSRMRLIWFNDQPEPWTIDAAAVAPTSGVSDAMVPLDAGGSAAPALWRPVTFGAASRLTIAGNPGPSAQPLLRMSDWIDLPPVARRDGPGALVLVRCFSNGRIRFSGGGSPDPALDQVHRSVWCHGDAASPPYAMARPEPADPIHACYGLQYGSAVSGVSVIGIGDSIMQSLRTTGTVSGYGARACAMLSTPQRPVSYFNEGFSGRQSADYGADGLRDLATLRPQMALIQGWSENDPWTREAADRSFAMAERLVDAARQVGALPVLVTAAPVFATRPGPERFRRQSNARVRALVGARLPVLDLDAIWGTGTDPNAYRDRFDCGDQTHPSDLGAVAAAKVLALAIRQTLA